MGWVAGIAAHCPHSAPCALADGRRLAPPSPYHPAHALRTHHPSQRAPGHHRGDPRAAFRGGGLLGGYRDRDELPNEAGASHFLEHLLFKGSETLTARQISETFDAMGAESNAFTTKEYTCFWARLLDQDLP